MRDGLTVSEIHDTVTGWMNDFEAQMEDANNQHSIEFLPTPEYMAMVFVEIRDGDNDYASDEVRAQAFAEFQTLPEWKILENRAEYCGVKLSPMAMAALLRYVLTPGDITLYISYIAYTATVMRDKFDLETVKSDKTGEDLILIRLADLVSVLNNRIITHHGLEDLWRKQKIARPKDYSGNFFNNNVLDYLSGSVIRAIHVITPAA